MTAQQMQETPLPCDKTHDTVFLIRYRVPETFQKFANLPETILKLVCAECYNTRPEYQNDIAGPILHKDGTPVEGVA